MDERRYEDFPTEDLGTGKIPVKTKKEKKVHRLPWFLGGIIAGFLITIVFGAAAGKTDTANTKVSENSVLNEETVDKLDVLKEYIDTYYYEPADATEETLQNGLYNGLMDSLGDPYTVYYTKEEFAEFMQESEGTYYGIGAYLNYSEDNNFGMISGVIPGSPAEAAGLQSGDIIYKIDGENAQGFELEEIVSRIRGDKGTTVKLTLYRENEGEIDVEIQRDEINAVMVTSKMLDNNVGYIQIVEFASVTTGQFKQAMKDLELQGMESLVLDLRGNPGGDVDVVTAIAEDILPEGLIFYMEDKDGNREEYTCGGADFKYPLVVLVDGNSASASEILSGAIQDAGIGTLVGTQTYGKGIVQGLFELTDGSGLKITIADYYTRNGRNIHGVGIAPDVEIEFDSELYSEKEIDNQLEKALEILNSQTKQGQE